MNLVDKPQASPDEYKSIWKRAKEQRYPQVEQLEKDFGCRLDPDFMNKLALHTQVVIKTSEICYAHGRVIYAALRKYLRDNNVGYCYCVDTGTARGFSALCAARALADANLAGDVVTFDLLTHNEKRWWNCIDDHEGKKTRKQLLKPWKKLVDRYVSFISGDVMKELEPRIEHMRINFAFLDSGHTYDVVRHEAKKIVPRQKKGDIIVYDDFSAMFPEVCTAIDHNCSEFGYSKKIVVANKQRGYAIARKEVK